MGGRRKTEERERESKITERTKGEGENDRSKENVKEDSQREREKGDGKYIKKKYSRTR